MSEAVQSAATAAKPCASADPATRASWLRAIADALDAATEQLVPIAHEESALPLARLTGEVARTSGQLRLMAEVVLEGSMFEVIVDTARPDLVPPRPELRRWLVPIGPVAVFGASNFPFAFSVLGGDTAAALAAGCPVVVKAHPGHPRLSEAVAAVALSALATVGAPEGMLTLVDSSLETGLELVAHPAIEAVAFTGSTKGGVALAQLAANRPKPIPFYGELGSVNPVFVSPEVAGADAESIAAGFAGSFTLGAGQFCTKPGVLVAPRGTLREALVTAVAGIAAQPLLHEGIRSAYSATLATRLEQPGIEILVDGAATEAGITPTLIAVNAAEIVDSAVLQEECFGPTSILVEYDSVDEAYEVARVFDGQLTTTVWTADDTAFAATVTEITRDRCGRVIVNGWPTGVAVTWSMHHGGPFPASTSALHTSVGATGIRRFVRPVCWQGAPDSLLPEGLRSGNPWGLPRRVDGAIEAN